MATKTNGNGVSIAESLHKGAGNFEVVRLSDGRVAYIFNPAAKVGPSKSGKTTLISTTAGALNLPGLPTISVNVFQ
jgi:ABC-type multidrug transport system ATPase subunit